MAKIDDLLAARPLAELMAMNDSELEKYFEPVLSLEPKALGVALFKEAKKPTTKKDLKKEIQRLLLEDMKEDNET